MSWSKKTGDLVHGKGLASLYHSGGRLYDVIDDLLCRGFDALPFGSRLNFWITSE